MELTINNIYRYKSSKSSYLDFRFKFLGMGEGCLKNWHHYINMDNGENCYMVLDPADIHPDNEEENPIETISLQPESTETIQAKPTETNHVEPTESATIDEKPEPLIVNPTADEKPAHRKRGRRKSAKTIEREQRKKEQEERRMMERRRAQFLIQQQQEQQRKERNRQKAISVFAGVLAAAAVIGVIFVGIGALGLLAFFGAGGMLAEAD